MEPNSSRPTGEGALRRRGFLFLGTASVAVLTAAVVLGKVNTISVPGTAPGPNSGPKSEPKDVLIENFDASGKSLGTARVLRVVKSEAEWQHQLTPQSFEITRHADTEPPFTGATWNNHADGLYHCICCDTFAFDSRTKFESGTGWPSFWQPISALNIGQLSDASFGMERTAIACRRCDAHLGHVFPDGPKPTGLRYCMNSGALRFAPRDVAAAKTAQKT